MSTAESSVDISTKRKVQVNQTDQSNTKSRIHVASRSDLGESEVANQGGLVSTDLLVTCDFPATSDKIDSTPWTASE